MQFAGRYLFSTLRDRVWAGLNDTDVLKGAIPGCRRIEWIGDSTLSLEVSVNLGMLSPTLSGELELSNVVPAERYTLSGRGRGPLLNLAHASADIVLADADGGTELAFTAHGHAGGAIARFGAGLIGERAQGVIDGFFARVGAGMGTTVTPLPR